MDLPNIPGSYAILFFTASDFTCITSHIPDWMLFLLWLCLFILSEVISPLISSMHTGHLPTWGVPLSVSYLFAFSCCSGGSRGRNTGVACRSLGPIPVDRVLSALSAMRCPPGVALLCMSHSFIDLDRGVVRFSVIVVFSLSAL